MKIKLLRLTLMLFCLVAFQTMQAKGIDSYKIPNVNDIETYKNLINKTLYYIPPKASYSNGISNWENFGYKVQKVKITNVEGKLKSNKTYQEMKWIVADSTGQAHKFTVYSGDYPKIPGYGKYEIENVPFFDLDKWKQDNSSLIGKVYSNPLVKAQYKIIDFSYGRNPNSHSLFDSDYNTIIYTVQNSITGKKNVYPADIAETSCFKEDLSGHYRSTLNKVEKPSNSAVKFGKTTVVSDEKDKGITKYSYKDNYIDIVIYGTSEQFYFTLKNVSAFTEKLVWDEAAFVDYKGKTSRVMHSGIKYSEREASQPESTIIKGASLEDIACPVDNVYYSELFKRWDTRSMYPSTPLKDTKQVMLMLPIKIKDVVNEYTFIFDVKYQYDHPDRLNIE